MTDSEQRTTVSGFPAKPTLPGYGKGKEAERDKRNIMTRDSELIKILLPSYSGAEHSTRVKLQGPGLQSFTSLVHRLSCLKQETLG